MLEVELAIRLGALELDVAFATPGDVTALFGRSVANLLDVSPTIYLNVPRGYAALLDAMKGK